MKVLLQAFAWHLRIERQSNGPRSLAACLDCASVALKGMECHGHICKPSSSPHQHFQDRGTSATAPAIVPPARSCGGSYSATPPGHLRGLRSLSEAPALGVSL